MIPFWFVVITILWLGFFGLAGFPFGVGKRPAARWRGLWSLLLAAGSGAAPLLLGVALGDLLHGVPVNASHEYTGSLADLLQPYGVFTGITFVAICVLHGATFLSLKTAGDLRERAGRLARRVAPVTGLVVLAFVSWTHAGAGQGALLNPVEPAPPLPRLPPLSLLY